MMKWLLLLTLIACGASKQADPPKSVALPESSASALGSTRPVAQPAPPEGITGVVECDHYIAAYTACRERLRPIEMAGDLPVFESARARLIMFAHDPEQRPSLPSACSAMLASIEPKCR